MIKKIFLYLWQLPQNLLGLIVILVTGARKSDKKSLYIAVNFPFFGVSLGNYIIFGFKYPQEISYQHERGHQKQSLYLGWLYLLVIGLPSVTGNLLHRKIKFDYYKQPWEKWADKLAGVKREPFKL